MWRRQSSLESVEISVFSMLSDNTLKKLAFFKLNWIEIHHLARYSVVVLLTLVLLTVVGVTARSRASLAVLEVEQMLVVLILASCSMICFFSSTNFL